MKTILIILSVTLLPVLIIASIADLVHQRDDNQQPNTIRVEYTEMK